MINKNSKNRTSERGPQISVVMKHLKNLTWAICLLPALLSSCSSSKNNDAVDVPEPALQSYGFYAADNAGKLAKDYVVTSIPTTGKIAIALPTFIENLNLVARFTTNDGNTVAVGGQAQVSKTSSNDFSIPADYIVGNSSGTLYKKYTVTVSKASDMVWSSFANYSNNTVYGGMEMKLSPTDDTPYVAYKIRNSDDDTKAKVVVLKLVDNVWTPVGDEAGFSGGEVYSSYYGLDIDSKGTPYVAYADNSNSLSGCPTVAKWNGSTWETVGSIGLNDTQATYLDIAMDENDSPVLTMVNASRKSAFSRYDFVAATYSSAWNSALLPGRAPATATYMSSMNRGADKAVYAALIHRGKVGGVNYGLSVFKYAASQWTTIRDNTIQEGATQTSIALKILGVIAASDGTVYLSSSDNAASNGGSVYNVRIEKYNASTQTWSTVGNVIDRKVDTSLQVKMALAPDGTLFVMYQDIQKYPTVIYFDNDTKQWSSPIALSQTAATDLNIGFTKAGIGYASFVDPDGHIATYKYDAK